MGSGRRIPRFGCAALAALALAAPAAAARTTAAADDFKARAAAVCSVEMGAVNRQSAAVDAAKTAVQQSKQMVSLAKALRKLSTRLSALAAPAKVATSNEWRELTALTRVAADDYEVVAADIKRGANAVGIRAYLARAKGEVAMAKIAAKKLGLTACSK